MSTRAAMSSKLKEITVLALFAALMTVSQVAMASLPNIELVSLFIILAAHFYGVRSLYSVYVFALCQMLIYGFGIWTVSYLYVWTVLALAVTAIRKHGNAVVYTVLAAVFGILFGTLCSIPYLFIGGITMAVSYILSGLTFDLLHCAGNLVSVALLFYPLSRLLGRAVFRNQ